MESLRTPAATLRGVADRPAPAGGGARRGALRLDGLPGWFTLHYQPEVDLSSGGLHGCEALLRWHHPDFGLLRPGPSLHESAWAPRLEELESWTIREACRQSVAWHRRKRLLPVALNVSLRRLRDPGFVPELVRAIEEAGARPEHLAIDVPLRGFTRHPVLLLDTVAALADLGVGVIVDGVFGDTARPFLADVAVAACKVPLHLAPYRLPGMHDSVETALQLARDLGATAVAKAVESEVELARAREMGFDRAFGHVFGPAVEPAALARMSSRTLGVASSEPQPA